MDEIEKQYECFWLNVDLRDHLLQLASDHFPLCQPQRRLVVETLVISNGERTVVDTEERDA